MILSEGVHGLNTGKQIRLLLLHQDRPTETLLQAAQTTMALTTGEQDPGGASCRQLLKGLKRGLRQWWTVDQDRFIRMLQPPGTPALTIAVRREQPEIGS